jgi:tRNA-splicing ligase RtcB
MEKNRITPKFVTELKDGEVFVFGSNLKGMHLGGAARIAADKFGAVWGQGVGMQGQSYAIPTMQGGVETIKPYVDEFINYAKEHTEYQFLVTEVGCVDKDTEFLTPSGWKKISDYSKGDKVAQYNVDDETIEFVEPFDYIKETCNEFLHFHTKYGIDQMLTPEHKCLVINSWNGKKIIKTAQEIYDRHYQNKTGCRDKFISTFKTKRSGVPLTDAQIRVLVMISADGCPNFNRIWLKFRKEHKIERAVKLLKEANIEYTLTKHKFETGIVFDRTDIIDKISFSNFWECSPHQLEIIADEVLYWDGNQKNIYYTRKKIDADFIQYCFSACGKRATLVTDKRKDGSLDYRVIFAENNTCPSLMTIPSKRDENAKIVKVIDEYKYCFTVSSGFLVFRRNKNIFITGNCGIAGFTPDEIAPLFKDAIEVNNISLPERFWTVLGY